MTGEGLATPAETHRGVVQLIHPLPGSADAGAAGRGFGDDRLSAGRRWNSLAKRRTDVAGRVPVERGRAAGSKFRGRNAITVKVGHNP